MNQILIQSLCIRLSVDPFFESDQIDYSVPRYYQSNYILENKVDTELYKLYLSMISTSTS